MNIDNIKIPVCFSFQTPVADVFKKDPYIPIGCGGYVFPEMKFSDSDGRIAGYNVYFNETTLIQWLGSHMADIGNPEYVGVAHYRRYFDLSRIPELKPDSIVCHYDRQPDTVFNSYCLYHVKSDLMDFSRRFIKAFPELERTYFDYLNETGLHTRNMFIMHRDVFAEYSCFVDQCVDILLGMIPNMKLDMRDKYQKRAPGFIMERMTGFWLYSVKAKYDLADTPITDIGIDSIYQRPAGGK